MRTSVGNSSLKTLTGMWHIPVMLISKQSEEGFQKVNRMFTVHGVYVNFTYTESLNHRLRKKPRRAQKAVGCQHF